jgi:hypothetical protein
MIEYRLNRADEGERVGRLFERDRNMPVSQRYDKLQEFTVAHDDELRPAAIYVASLLRELEKCRIDQQFLIAIALRTGRIRDSFALRTVKTAAPIDRDIPNIGGKFEDAIMKIHRRSPLRGSRRILNLVLGCSDSGPPKQQGQLMPFPPGR